MIKESMPELGIATMQEKALQIASFLKTIGNDTRLIILCHLMQNGELTVNEILRRIPSTSQSSLSQHLAKMRAEGLIEYRRDAQTLYYSIRDKNVFKIISALRDTFCTTED